MYDIIIIGAGPAGLSAAIYARRANKKVLVLEEKSFGGQIVNTLNIANYPANENISGFDFANNLYNQAKNLGAEIKFEGVIEVKNLNGNKKVITKNNNYQTKTIIIATGCQNRKLNIPNEDKFMGRGISYCATCDGNFYRNMDVAIIGGGNTAIEDALYLSDIAKKVYLIHRRDTFRADNVIIEQLKKKDNVEFILNSNVISINGDNKIESIDIKNNDGNTKRILISGLFIAVGQIPASVIFNNKIKMDNNGYIVARENCHTNRKGIFVAGDVRTKELRQLVTATSDGAIAATEAIKYLNNL